MLYLFYYTTIQVSHLNLHSTFIIKVLLFIVILVETQNPSIDLSQSTIKTQMKTDCEGKLKVHVQFVCHAADKMYCQFLTALSFFWQINLL